MQEQTLTFSHNGCNYPPYVAQEDEKLLSLHNAAEKAFREAFKELNLPLEDFYIDFHLLNNALIRTDQRTLHYLMYHDGMRMNELKQIAVFSYWVLRFKPINRIAGGPTNINEKVVLSWISKSIKLFRSKNKKPARNFGSRMEKDLLYAFTYRDISYDYMTILVESLAE